MAKPGEHEGAAEHVLKTWPQFFEASWEGDKPFEVRSSKDRTFLVGDRVRLREYHVARGSLAGEYTGREIEGVITYVLDGGRKQHDADRMGFDIEHGTCVFAYRTIKRVR